MAIELKKKKKEKKTVKRQEPEMLGNVCPYKAINTVINYPRPRSKWIHEKKKKQNNENMSVELTNQ